MKILITGINGFIGQHLTKELFSRGHEVIGLGRSKKCFSAKVFQYYSGNILDKKFVARTMRDIEIVVHLAALTSHKEIVDDKFTTLETNFLGTKNILDAFVSSKSTKKFFYSSTGKVYGKIQHLPISEDHKTNPMNLLGKSKCITEQLIDFYTSDKKEFITFRIFNIYGSRQKSNFLIPTILAQLNKKKTQIILGDIKAKRDYVFIDDLVRAFVLAIEKKGQLGLSIYNICTGIGSSAEEIVKIISVIKGKRIQAISNLSLLRSDEMENEYGSYEKAKNILGWEPKYSLQEGLRKLLLQQ
jgi:UDP-glucose 4-epimerase